MFPSDSHLCVYWIVFCALFYLNVSLFPLLQNFGLEYERYLKEVVSILETDEVFKKKLASANISDIQVSNLFHESSFIYLPVPEQGPLLPWDYWDNII